MRFEQLDATSAVALCFPFRGHEALWELAIERAATGAPIKIMDHGFSVELTLLDPWDKDRRILILRQSRDVDPNTNGDLLPFGS